MPRVFFISIVLLSLFGCELDQPVPEKPPESKEIKNEVKEPTSSKSVYKYSVNETSQQDPEKDFYSIEKPLIKGEKIHPQASEDLLE